MSSVNPTPAERPSLRQPILIAAFHGWNDAGEAATEAVEHLVTAWGAEEFVELDSESYYDYQVTRPTVAFVEGDRVIRWPTTRFLLARRTDLDHDIVLALGIEPSSRWKQFAEEVVELCQKLGVTTIITLGAMITDVPHTRPLPLWATSDDPALVERFHTTPSSYEGPTGIVGVLGAHAARAGIPVVSAWTGVPPYADIAPSPKATLRLLAYLQETLHTAIPFGDLVAEAASWEHDANALMLDDEDMAEYVQALETAQDTQETADLPEASGDAIAREFENYLKGRDGETR